MENLLDAEAIFAVLGPFAMAFALVLGRVVGLIATTPLLSSPLLPNPIKAALAGVLTLFVAFGGGVQPPSVDLNALALAGALVGELIVGAVMGLSVSIAFGALHFCGQMIGIQMGFAVANVVDPSTFQQVGVIAQVLNECEGVQIKAAQRLGINRNTLHKKIKDYGLDGAPTPGAKTA